MPEEIDANGLDLPDRDTEFNVDSDLKYAVRSRAFTWEGREFYDQDFGFDVVRQDNDLIHRMETSLAQIPGWVRGQVAVSVRGTPYSTLELDVRMTEP